ncbi:MAG: alpha/beta hydrolase [Pseudomonadota bacterium]
MASPELLQLIEGMRATAPDFGAPPTEVRAVFESLLAGMPSAEGSSYVKTSLGGVPALECHHGGDESRGTLLYFHGGGYIAGSARGYRGLPTALAAAANLAAVAIDYRLAPEAPFPAAIDDGVAAYLALLGSGVAADRIVFAGDSAGGGLVMATLLKLRDAGHPLPAAAVLLSPWVDLAGQGASFEGKAVADPSLTPAGLRASAVHYLGGEDARNPLASPVHADLAGLPPLLIQVGSSEILLDDAVRLAGAAGAADTFVKLEIWPEMIHVWQSFAFMLPEGAAAVAEIGTFLTTQLAKD